MTEEEKDLHNTKRINEDVELVAEAIRLSQASYHTMLSGFLRQLVDERRTLNQKQRGIIDKHLYNRHREAVLLQNALDGKL